MNRLDTVSYDKGIGLTVYLVELKTKICWSHHFQIKQLPSSNKSEINPHIVQSLYKPYYTKFHHSQSTHLTKTATQCKDKCSRLNTVWLHLAWLVNRIVQCLMRWTEYCDVITRWVVYQCVTEISMLERLPPCHSTSWRRWDSSTSGTVLTTVFSSE